MTTSWAARAISTSHPKRILNVGYPANVTLEAQLVRKLLLAAGAILDSRDVSSSVGRFTSQTEQQRRPPGRPRPSASTPGTLVASSWYPLSPEGLPRLRVFH